MTSLDTLLLSFLRLECWAPRFQIQGQTSQYLAAQAPNQLVFTGTLGIEDHEPTRTAAIPILSFHGMQ